MADINDPKSINRQTKAVNENTLAIEKNIIATQKQIKAKKEEEKQLRKLLPNYKELVDDLNDLSVSEFTDELKDLPNLMKNAFKLGKGFESYSESIKLASRKAKEMGFVYNKELQKIHSKAGSVAKSFDNIILATRKLSSIKSNLSGIPEQLKIIGNAFKQSFDLGKSKESIKGIEDKISDLRSNMSAKEFSSFEGLFKKLDTKDINVFAATVDEIKDKFSKVELKPGVNEKDISTAKDKVKEINETLSKVGSPEDFKTLSDTIKNQLKVFEDIKNVDAFSELYNKEIEPFVEDLKKSLAEPSTDWEKTVKKVEDLNKKINTSFEQFSSDSETKIKEMMVVFSGIRTKLEETHKSLEEPFNFLVNTSNAEAEIKDFLNTTKAMSYDFEVKGIVPNEELTNTVEIQKKLKHLIKLKEQYALVAIKIDELGDTELAQKEKLIDEQVRLKKELQETLAVINKTKDSVARHLTATEKLGRTSWGHQKAAEVGDALAGWSANVTKFGNNLKNSGPILAGVGKLVGGIGTQLGKLGELALQFGGELAIIGAGVALIKFLIKWEGAVADLNRSVAQTGVAFDETSATVTSAIKKSVTQTTNLYGLWSARLGEKEFVHTQERILAVNDALFKSGITTKNLQKEMKGIDTTVAAIGNEFVGAANIVRTFSLGLNITDEDMASLMGNMKYEFGSTMGTLKDGFTEINVAVHNSGMSTNRFMGIVQTATAGMSLYEDQVRDVSKVISGLAQDSRLTGKDIEKAVKSVTEFSQDTDKVFTAFAMIRKSGGDKRVIEKLGQSIAKMQEKVRAGKATPQEKQQLENMKDMRKSLEGGKFAQAAALMKTASPEVQEELFASLEGEIRRMASKSGAFDPYLFENIMKKVGFSPDFISTELARRGAVGEDLSKGPNKLLAEQNKKFPKTQEEIAAAYLEAQDKAYKQDQLTTNKSQAVLDAVKKWLTALPNKWSRLLDILEGIGVIIATIGAAKFGLKLWKFFAKAGAGAKGFLKTAAEAAGQGTEIAAKEASMTEKAPGFFGKILKFFKPSAKAGEKGGELILEKPGIIGAEKAASKAAEKAAEKGAVKVASKGLKKAIPVIGNIISFGYVLSDLYSISNKMAFKKNVLPSDWQHLGLDTLEVLPYVQYPALAADVAMEATGGYDEMDRPFVKPPQPAGVPVDVTKKVTPDLTKGTEGAMTTSPPESRRADFGSNVIININGGNEERVKKIVAWEIYQATGKSVNLRG